MSTTANKGVSPSDSPSPLAADLFGWRPRILAVDDEPLNLEILKEELDQKCELFCAESGKKACKILKTTVIDLALLDVMLPEMDGYELSRHIKLNKRLPFVKIILLSGLNRIENRLKGYQAGADDYLAKPFNIKELNAKIRVYYKMVCLERGQLALNANQEEIIYKKTQKIQDLYITDEGTGLGNRAKLYRDIEASPSMALMVLDIVSFGKVNMAFGIQTGDLILKQVALKLKSQIKNSEQLYRIGGDEFAVCCFGSKDIAMEQIKKLPLDFHRHLNGMNIHCNGVDINVDFAIGVVKGGEGKELIKKVYLSLAEAKRRSHPRIAFYNPKQVQDKRHKQNLVWIKKVKEAIMKNRLVPFFQGIHDNRSGNIKHYECLARLIDGSEIIPPVYFLEAAKQAGLLPEITQVMIASCFAFFKSHSCRFSINISNEDMNQFCLVSFVREQLEKTGIHPERIVFEVLEEVSLGGNEKMIENIEALKGLGCKLAIDDFGTAYSNFAQLMNLKVDYIKIDGQFIKNLTTSDKSYKIVKTITDFSHNIGAEVIAEFIHNEATQECAKSLNIDYSQGYYFSKPSPTIDE